MSRLVIPTNINIKNPLALAKVAAAKKQGIGRNLSETAENLILRGAEVSLLKDESQELPADASDAPATDANREASAA